MQTIKFVLMEYYFNTFSNFRQMVTTPRLIVTKYGGAVLSKTDRKFNFPIPVLRMVEIF